MLYLVTSEMDEEDEHVLRVEDIHHLGIIDDSSDKWSDTSDDE